MRTNNILSMAAVFCLLLCGCSKEDAYHQEDADTAVGAALSLQVSTAAYQCSAGTRATDAELSTTFTEGDQLGIIVTGQGKAPEHFVYTYDGSAWTSTTPVYYAPQNTYAAYYPYRKSLSGKSLAEVKAAFTPLVDQSDYATGYAASDLMTCENATPNTADNSLPVTLTHAFSMLRMKTDIPVNIECGDGKGYEYSLPGTNIAFYIGNTPYRAWVDNDGYARLIVKNSGSSTAVKSSYTVFEKRVESSYTISTFASGQYYTVTPSRADFGEYTLSDARMGDFYCIHSDNTGFVIPQEASPASVQEADCLGIVLKAGKDTDGDWKDDCVYKQKGTDEEMTVHGYVLALPDNDHLQYCKWGTEVVKVEHKDMMREQTGFYGYKETNAIIAFNQSKGGTLADKYPATYYATVGYETKHPAPTNSSGWFLPSAGQCQYWIENENKLNVLGDFAHDEWNQRDYWSSSEDSEESAEKARVAYFNLGASSFIMTTRKKNNGNFTCSVRPCLAF